MMEPQEITARLAEMRDEAGAEAIAFVGLGDVGGRLFVSHSLVHAPEAWGLSWTALDGWSARVLFDLPGLWAALGTDQLAPVSLELLRNGTTVLPGGREAPNTGWAAGRLVQTEHQLAGFILVWPFPTLDRLELARFRINDAVDTIIPGLASRMTLARMPAQGRTAVLCSEDGSVLHTDPLPAHPLHDDRIAARTAEAVRSMRPGESVATGSAYGWHLRLHLLDGKWIGARLTPIHPVPLPITHILPPQQRRVAILAAAGHSTAAIAEQLDVRPQTVRTHLKHVYRRLQASNRVELANRLSDDPIHRIVSR